MTTPTPDLLPCPFCGSAKVTTKNEHTDLSGGYYIECSACLACTGMRFACGEDPRPMLVEQWNRRAELEARKPLPLSYRAGAMASSIDGGATVSLHFNDAAEAEAWFVAITDQHDAQLVDKSPNLQEPPVDKTANLQDRPASLIASREVVADGPVRVTRLNLTKEGRAALTSKATGPLPGITGGSS